MGYYLFQKSVEEKGLSHEALATGDLVLILGLCAALLCLFAVLLFTLDYHR